MLQGIVGDHTLPVGHRIPISVNDQKEASRFWRRRSVDWLTGPSQGVPGWGLRSIAIPENLRCHERCAPNLHPWHPSAENRWVHIRPPLPEPHWIAEDDRRHQRIACLLSHRSRRPDGRLLRGTTQEPIGVQVIGLGMGPQPPPRNFCNLRFESWKSGMWLSR